MYTRAYIETSALEHLFTTLNLVKEQNGIVDTERTWLRCSASDLLQDDHSLDSSHSVDKLHSNLLELVATERALRSLLRTAEEAVAVLQEKCEPLLCQRGVQSLPDEILGRIFELGCEADDYHCPCVHPVTISHVNQRFRMVALASPRIWSFLHNAQHNDQLQTYITRSKTTGLTLLVSYDDAMNELHHPKGEISLTNFFDIVSGEIDRWKDIRLSAICDDALNELYGHRDLFLRHKFHRLSNLAYLRAGEQKPLARSGDPDTRLFLTEWLKPNVHSFHGRNVPLDASMFGACLATCHLEFVTLEQHDWNMQVVLGGLSSLPNLDSLSLTFENFSSTLHKLPSTKLPKLRSLSTSISISVNLHSISWIFDALDLPQLWSHSIEIRTDALGYLEDILQKPQSRPNLYTLRLLIHPSNCSRKIDVLSNVMTIASSLREVHLQIPGLIVSLPRRDSTVAWNTACFERCDGFDDRVIQRIVEAIRRGNEKDQIHELQIKHCPRISHRALQRLLVQFGHRLKYQI